MTLNLFKYRICVFRYISPMSAFARMADICISIKVLIRFIEISAATTWTLIEASNLSKCAFYWAVRYHHTLQRDACMSWYCTGFAKQLTLHQTSSPLVLETAICYFYFHRSATKIRAFSSLLHSKIITSGRVSMMASLCVIRLAWIYLSLCPHLCTVLAWFNWVTGDVTIRV